MQKNKKVLAELLEQAKQATSQQAFNRAKARIAKKYKLTQVPKNTDIISSLENNDLVSKHQRIISKPIRTGAGVAPVAIMGAPIACPPQAKCTYCPGGPGSAFGDVPKSYTPGAPAVNRAIRNKYDPYLQVMNRLEQYVLLGQDPSKVELIIMGGTFPSFHELYRIPFMTAALQAMNDFSTLFFSNGLFNKKSFNKFFLLPGERDDKQREQQIMEKLKKYQKETTLDFEKEKNEQSHIRCIAMVMETRPDCSYQKEIDDMLYIGTTRVELGVQSLYDNVLEKIKRGHSVATTAKATALLRDSFLKVGYHMMLGLPETTKDMDIAMMKQVFEDPAFRPDALKVYPCMVMKGTPLYEDWKNGTYDPIDTEEALQRIIKVKPSIPEYCRIMRIQRDLPTYQTKAGVDKTNLRQMIHQRMPKNICRCIRCRQPQEKDEAYEHTETKVQTYEASEGTEVFISQEDTKQDRLLGYCRLRIPAHPFRKEITAQTAGIRELHVFGKALQMKSRPDKHYEVQHRGTGKLLMEEAERIAREEYDMKKMLVISGIGVREYYRKKLSYAQDGPYVGKKL